MDGPSADTEAAPRKRRDTRQCRICLSGAEEEQELGPLIKPCRCKGSIRYVHVVCINTWRKTGTASNQNFWACAQCGHKYNISRTKILGLSSSPWVLVPTTVAFFLMIVFAASFVVSFLLPDLDDPSLIVPPPEPELGLTWWHSPLGIASEVIRETVHTFAEVSTPQEVVEAHKLEMLRNVDDTSLWGRFKRRIPFRKENKPKRRGVKRIDPRAPYSPSEDGPRVTIWARLLRRFMLGLSLVGILSFLNLLITMSLFGPLQIARARWIRGGRREGGGLQDIGTILIIVFVTIGVARALYGVYSMTKMLAQYALQRAESAILEVQDDDDEEEGESEVEQAPESSSGPSGPSKSQSDPDVTVSGNAEAADDSKLRRRPDPLQLNGSRARKMPDDFGEELPDTPGGWREEWDF